MHYLYILYSASLSKYYIGYTSTAPELRLQKHLALHKGFTSKATDWQIVYTETFPSKTLAMQREKQLKSWKSKIRIEELIKRSSTE